MEEKKEKKEGLFAKIKKIKHIEIIIAVAAVIIMLVIYFAGFGSSAKKSTSDSTEQPEFYSDYCRRMQSELTELVSKMDGAGDTRVIINWESSVELILAASQSSSTNSATSSPTIINNSGISQPIVLKEIYPKALGVVVVCQGGGDARLKVNIIMGVSVLLNISTEKVLVYPMAKK